ncbi:unnamed protein product [Lactuca saligna]|uniref:GRF-type domain-containing protein n=1 Tax=Lactuca saligna TaxID=75948 RepID=A0AA36E6Z6_LACSI|nr:unnamed protein product [Lactuca saligna]
MVICTCGSVVVRITSWTDLNPGRRFWSCARNGRSCPFLGWVDDLMCHKVVEVIPGLLRRMNNVQMMLIQARADVVKLKWMLILSWFFFFRLYTYALSSSWIWGCIWNLGMEWKELCPFIKDWNGMSCVNLSKIGME